MRHGVHAIFCLLFSHRSYFGIEYLQSLSSSSCSHCSVVWLTFRSVAQFCQTLNQLCVAFKVFWFLEFSFSCSALLCFEIAKRLSAILFLFSNLALQLPYCTQEPKLHSITYLCIRNYPIRNEIFC